MPFFVLLLSICAIYDISAFINTRNYNIDNIKKHCYKLKLYRMKAVGEMLKSELTTTQEEEELWATNHKKEEDDGYYWRPIINGVVL